MISSQQPACFTFSLIILYRLIYLHTSPTAEPLSPSPLAQKKPSHTLWYERVFFNIPVHPH